MRFPRPSGRRPDIAIVATSGDFPHARRKGVRLACCTTTTCCFTLLLGGVGGLAGIIAGLRKAISVRAAPASPYFLPLAYAGIGYLFTPALGDAGVALAAALFLAGGAMAVLQKRGKVIAFNKPIAVVGRFLFILMLYTVIGVCIGAALGFGIDSAGK